MPLGGAGGIDLRPFYREIGDQRVALAGGSVSKSTDAPVTATGFIAIASASKWIYSSYWAQRTSNNLSDSDIKFFTFWMGYTSFTAPGSLRY